MEASAFSGLTGGDLALSSSISTADLARSISVGDNLGRLLPSGTVQLLLSLSAFVMLCREPLLARFSHSDLHRHHRSESRGQLERMSSHLSVQSIGDELGSAAAGSFNTSAFDLF